MDRRQPCMYMLASKRNGTLYIGVTSDLIKRVWQHRNEHDLVWYELYETMGSAILREKQLKEWKRAWKLRLIEGGNPGWLYLYPTLL